MHMRRQRRSVGRAIDKQDVRKRQLAALRAIKDGPDLLSSGEYPHWATPETVSKWVRDLRKEADDRSMRKVGRLLDGASD